VTLQTDIRNYVLTDICVNSLNNNWCGDVEEWSWPFVGCTANPDPYVRIFDADGINVYTSPSIGDVQSGCWGDLNVLMINPPYVIEVWDADPTSADDNLGNFPFNIDAEGQTGFSGAGGTSGILTFSSVLDTSYIAIDTVIVGLSPAAIIDLMADTNMICEGESVELESSPGVFYQWYKNGETIVGAVTQNYTVSSEGLYTVEVADVYGCSNVSVEQQVLVEALPPTPILSYNSVTNELVITNSEGYNIDWYYNGALIPWAKDTSLLVSINGEYMVQLSTDLSCSTSSVPMSIVVHTGISSQISDAVLMKNLFPNPANTTFFVDLETLTPQDVELMILDKTGRVVLNEQLGKVVGEMRKEVDVSKLSKGLYFVVLSSGNLKVVRKLAVQ
jgi:hypothetical protein